MVWAGANIGERSKHRLPGPDASEQMRAQGQSQEPSGSEKVEDFWGEMGQL